MKNEGNSCQIGQGCRVIIVLWTATKKMDLRHYETESYKKKKYNRIKAYRKYVKKEPTVKRCLLITDLKAI